MTTVLKQMFVWMGLLSALSAGAQTSIYGQPAPEVDALFQQTNGWIGGDGVCSVALAPDRTVWLFSDTWVGSVRDGRRTNATIVNNTLALQKGQGAGAKLQFIVRRNGKGKPVAFLTPEDKRGWFWMHSGVCIDNKLFLFLMQIEKTDAGGAFGFRQTGESLGIVTNPLAPPLEWHIEQHKLPCADFTPGRGITFGAAALVNDGYLYVYGTDEDRRREKLERYLIVARVPTNQVSEFSAWQYYAGGRWSADYHEATRLAARMASEYSVSFLPNPGKYVLVYTDEGLSPKIQVQTSRTPWGEWSVPRTVFHCPEMSADKRLFCYTGKYHPSLGTDNELMISYVVNSFDFAQVVNNAKLYWPKFVRVPVAAISATGER